MLRLVPLVAIFLLARAAAAAEPVEVRAAVEKALASMTGDALDWKSERKCSSCHQVPMCLWTANEAKKRGYTVDDKAVAELMAWVLDPADPGKIYPAQPPKEPPKPEEITVNQSPLMLSFAIAEGSLQDEATRAGYRKMLKTVVEQQRPNGSWALYYVWEPFGPTADVITTWVVLSLMSPAAVELVPEAKEARDKALAWLAATKPGPELQSLAMKLLLARRLGRGDAEWQPLVAQIIGRQNADGGWSQADGMSSDAYATGVVLYVLGESRTPGDDGPIAKAQAYLVKTQQSGGDWEMASRDGGPKNKSASDTTPIAYAATAWAVMGLVRTVPAAIEAK